MSELKESHLRILNKLARNLRERYPAPGQVDLDDLVHVGVVALLERGAKAFKDDGLTKAGLSAAGNAMARLTGLFLGRPKNRVRNSELQRIYNRERLKKWKEKGVCTHCGRERDGYRMYCKKCRQMLRRSNMKRYYTRKREGRCVQCGRACGGAYCPEHAAERNKAVKKREARLRLERRETGVCLKCGGKRDDPAFVTCSECRIKVRKRAKVRSAKLKAKLLRLEQLEARSPATL